MDSSLDDVVKITGFVKEMNELEEIHNMRFKYFNKACPASTLVQITDFVSLDFLVGIEAAVVEIS